MSPAVIHHSVDTNGVRYHVAETGRGPALVLLHGFTGSHAAWLGLTQLLAADYRVIAVDLLGHGETDAPQDPRRYTMEHAATDLDALMTALGIDRFHLLGYSMGGRLALFVALAYPARIRSLVLEGASPGLDDPGERAARIASDQALATRIERDGIEAFVQRWEALPLFASQSRLPVDVRAQLHGQRLTNVPRGLANSLRGMGTGVQPSLWTRLNEVGVPTLLITGAEDDKFCAIARAMAAQMPHAAHVSLAAAGHTVHLEDTAAFAAAFAGFLEQQARQ